MLVLGASGMLGSFFCETVKSNKKLNIFKFFRSNNEFNLLSKDSVNRLLKFINPDIIINCIGLTDVDYCEINKSEAFLINSKIPENFGHFPGLFIHISTDQVYPGIKGNYYENETKPINVYGKSKLSGEKMLNNNSLILRTNFFGYSSAKRQSLSDYFIKSFKQKEKFFLFNDLFFSPLHMKTLTVILEGFITNNRINGIFNIGSSNGISKSDFALKIAKHFNFSNSNYEIINSDSFSKNRAVRPKNTSLNIKKISDIIKFSLPSVEEEILKL